MIMSTSASALDWLLPRPSAVLKVLESADSADLSIAQLADIVSVDPVLSARVLRLANSLPYRKGEEVASLTRALVLLGATTVRALTARAALPMLNNDAQLIPDDLWLHSVTAAAGARVSAESLGVDPDQAFSAGLLHDIGALTRYTSAADAEPGAASSEEAERIRLEHAFAVEHPVIGARLAEQLGFPRPVVDAIRNHHQPVGEVARLTQAVIIGDAIACALNGPGLPEPTLSLPQLVAEVGIGLRADRLLELARNECDRLGRALGVAG